jgi:hypothetical protein
VILAVLFQEVNIANLSNRITTASPEWVFLAAMVFVSTYFVRAIRWKIILGRQIGLSQLFHILQIGYLSNNVLPLHLSEFVRSWILQEKEKVHLGYGFSSIALERVMDIMALLILAIIGTSIFPVQEGQLWLSGMIQNVGSIAAILLIALIILTIRPNIFRRIAMPAKRISYLSKIGNMAEDFLNNFSNGVRSMSARKSNFIGSFTLTFVIWLIDFMAVYLLFRSMSLNVPVIVVLVGFIGTILLLALPSTPAYIGSYELFWVAAFTAIGYGGSEEILAVGILSHILFIAITTVLGVVGLFVLRISFGNILSRGSAT